MAPEQQEGHCPVVQSSSVPPVSEGLCCTEEPQPPPFDFRPKPDDKPSQAAQGPGVILLPDVTVEGLSSLDIKGVDDSCKDPLLKDFSTLESCNEDKKHLPNGRRRRFTGDSGIEVCVCGTPGNNVCRGAGGTGQDSKELESLLRRNEEEEADDFCDSCGHQASFSVEEEGSAGHEAMGSPQAPQSVSPPVCLLLHTISEQDGAAHSTEPQG